MSPVIWQGHQETKQKIQSTLKAIFLVLSKIKLGSSDEDCKILCGTHSCVEVGGNSLKLMFEFERR